MAAVRSRRVVGVATLLGIVGTVIAIVLDPSRALLGYLAAYVVVASVAIGALVMLLIGYATNARWLAAIRGVQVTLATVFPVLAVLFLPIAIGVHYIYAWAGSRAIEEHERVLLDAKAAWLNPTGFIFRAVFYFAVFIIASEVLRYWLRRRDSVVEAADPEAALSRERVFASAMLVPVALALTFASIDWVMSLEPLWVSSMFPVYFFAAGFSASLALLAIVAAGVRVELDLTGHHFHALGRLVFAFVVFWAYTSYFQGFLIQIANRPNEITFYVARTTGIWGPVLWAIIALRFVLPFALLLPRALKHRSRYVAGVSALLLVGHVLDLYWVVIPSGARTFSWMDVVPLVAIAGVCTAFAAWRARGRSLVASGDPFLVQGLRYESPT